MGKSQLFTFRSAITDFLSVISQLLEKVFPKEKQQPKSTFCTLSLFYSGKCLMESLWARP